METSLFKLNIISDNYTTEQRKSKFDDTQEEIMFYSVLVRLIKFTKHKSKLEE